MTTNAYKQIDSNQSIEHKLLITINELTNNLLDSLDTVNIILSTMQNNVTKLDNEIISNNYNNSINVYNVSKVSNVKSEFINFKNSIESAIEDIEDHCEHEWIDDLIDITPDRSQHITYCKHCEITK
jgi:hypothetical protein